MGLVKTGTSPATKNSKTSESPQNQLPGKMETLIILKTPKCAGIIFFHRSLSSAEVSTFCATAVLNVALCDLQDEASGGFRKPCCTEEAQFSLSNSG